MSVMTVKKILSVLLAVIMVLVFAGCSKKTEENNDETGLASEVVNATDNATEQPIEATTEEIITAAETTTEETTIAETTTAETTTAAPETTTKPDGSSIKGIIDTLEGQKFYLAGIMKMQSGETIDMKMTCDGEDYKLEMNSRQMKMSMIYLGGSPYIVNNSTNSYILFDDTAIDSLDQVLNSFSSYGISFTGNEMEEMKSMMKDFDQNMDFSQYINQGEYSEYTAKVDGVDHLCSVYETEYGAIRIYTLAGTLKVIDVYDADGLRQMNMTVSAFIPQVLTPISLTGLSQSPSILHLFGLA